MSTKIDSFCLLSNGGLSLEGEYEQDPDPYGCACSSSCYHGLYIDLSPEMTREIYEKLKKVFE